MRWFVLLSLLLGRPALAQAPDSTYDFAEVQPELVGGLAALQQGIVYPDAERLAGVQGRVIVTFVVDEAGVPAAIAVARSISPGLDSAAVLAVRAARFTPGTQAGVPVRVRFTLPVNFRLDTPPAGLDVDTLFARLGRPWSAAGLAPPDSGAVTSRAGRLLWRSDGGEVERVLALVVADTLREIETTAAFGADVLTSIRRLADTIDDQPGLAVDSTGYYTAYAMAQAGLVLPQPRDVRLDLDRRAWSLRAPACAMRWEGACVVTQPVLVGGIQALQTRIEYPGRARRAGLQGRVYVTFIVADDGSIRDIAMVPGARTSGPQYLLLHEAAIRAVQASRFLPARGLEGELLEVPYTIPVTFSLR